MNPARARDNVNAAGRLAGRVLAWPMPAPSALRPASSWPVGRYRRTTKTTEIARRVGAANSFEVTTREWLAMKAPGWNTKQHDEERNRP